MNIRWSSAVTGLIAVAALAGTAFANAPGSTPMRVLSTPQVGTPARFATTPPLRDVDWQMPTILQRIVSSHTVSRWQMQMAREQLIKLGYLHVSNEPRSLPVHRKSYFISPEHNVTDSVRQTAIPRLHVTGNGFTDLLANFDTISNQWSIYPPDPNAAVGENDVIMIVNLGFAVYDKSGNLLMGPVNTNTLWASIGGQCAADNEGDPIVLYDRLGHHWLITQFAFGSGPAYQCIAISETEDPTGSWYEYQYKIANSGLNDYPKFGVWPDAFYANWNWFPNNFSGVIFGAFDRVAMESGDPNAQDVLFTTNQNNTLAYSDLPVTMDGTNPPPAGDPGIFINYVSPGVWGLNQYSLELWQLHVDWSNPANSTFTGPTEIDVAPFNDTCGGGLDDCVPQPTGPQLESLSDRLMYRLAYRNLGDHQALVLMHNVASSNDNAPIGERWYELDAPAGSTDPTQWTIAQQSTFMPNDGLSRWMGSIAMDQEGNIAMGYSTSSSSQPPSIVYTGRLATDPANEMTEPETTILAGVGSQTGSAARWGDYSSMVTDPTDDCTFWYANEWIPQTSQVGWRGHIAAFKFPNCQSAGTGTVQGTVTDASSGNPIQNATVSFVPGGSSVMTDQQGQYSITLAPDTYTATAAAVGYQSDSASVTVTEGQTTTQDFSLSPSGNASLHGRVYDSGHQYPLYAEVVVTASGQQVADVWTNPSTGVYNATVPTGTTYSVTATAYLNGYAQGTATVTVNGDTQQMFSLSPDSSCSAPGWSMQSGTCTPLPGGLVVGTAYDGNTRHEQNPTKLAGITITDENGNGTTTVATAGGYTGFVLFEAPGSHTLTASGTGWQDNVKTMTVSDGSVKATAFVMRAGELAARPDQVTMNVPVNTQQTLALHIGNQGIAPVDWTLTSINSPPPSRPQNRVSVPLHRVHGYFSPTSLLSKGIYDLGIKHPVAANPVPRDSAWAAIADYPIDILDNCSATDETSGLVYSVMGVSDGSSTASGYAYDSSSNSWSSIANAPEALEKPACAIINGKIYVTAGWDSSGNNNPTLYIYDIASDSWSTGANLPIAVGGGAVGVALNGEFYVIGGCANSSSCPGTTGNEVYDPSSNSWSAAADYPEGISWEGCGASGGEIYCGGGVNASGSGDTTDAYAYDPGADSWSTIAALMYDNWAMSATGTADGHLLFQDGVTGGFATITNQGQIYDVATNTWSALPNNVVTTYRGTGACGFYMVGGMDSSNLFDGIQSAEVLSGYNVCGLAATVPWLSFNPASGTLAPSQITTSTATIDGTGQSAGTSVTVQIVLGGNTPYGNVIIPLTVNWTSGS